MEPRPPASEPELDGLRRLQEENARLREANRGLEELIGIAPAFFGFLSPEGVITGLNDLALQIIEADREAVIGLHFWDAPWWASVPASAQRVREAVVRAGLGVASEFDIEYAASERGQPQRRWVALGITPFSDPSGRVVRI